MPLNVGMFTIKDMQLEPDDEADCTMQVRNMYLDLKATNIQLNCEIENGAIVITPNPIPCEDLGPLKSKIVEFKTKTTGAQPGTYTMIVKPEFALEVVDKPEEQIYIMVSQD